MTGELVHEAATFVYSSPQLALTRCPPRHEYLRVLTAPCSRVPWPRPRCFASLSKRCIQKRDAGNINTDRRIASVLTSRVGAWSQWLTRAPEVGTHVIPIVARLDCVGTRSYSLSTPSIRSPPSWINEYFNPHLKRSPVLIYPCSFCSPQNYFYHTCRQIHHQPGRMIQL